MLYMTNRRCSVLSDTCFLYAIERVIAFNNQHNLKLNQSPLQSNKMYTLVMDEDVTTSQGADIVHYLLEIVAIKFKCIDLLL